MFPWSSFINHWNPDETLKLYLLKKHFKIIFIILEGAAYHSDACMEVRCQLVGVGALLPLNGL